MTEEEDRKHNNDVAKEALDTFKEQVEFVFGLTGGELEDEPWKFFKYNPQTDDSGDEPSRDGDQRTNKYWYEGVPDYVSREISDRYDNGVSYRTMVADHLYGEGFPRFIEDESGLWERTQIFGNSGETECPDKNNEGKEIADEDCLLCDAKKGEEHGMIYIGDGWMEVIYRHQDLDEEELEEIEVECPVCKSDNIECLGLLGKRLNFRCKACHMDFSRKLEDEDAEKSEGAAS